MIAYTAQVHCNGCGDILSSNACTDNLEDLVDRLSRGISHLAVMLNWTEDRGAHYCPNCVRRADEVQAERSVTVELVSGERIASQEASPLRGRKEVAHTR